ncbi:MAG: hypothetical protein KDA68_13510 [Planctomycetaceae bacterium]|nr:hypothetical protein [Planctomycetaceae bacterium]
MTWATGETGTETPPSIVAQKYDPSGKKLGPLIVVSSNTSTYLGPGIAIDANGNFVIGWIDYTPNDSTDNIYARRFDASGNPLGPEFLIDSPAFAQHFEFRIAMNSNGDFAVAWSGNNGFFGPDIFVRRYDSQGIPQGDKFIANSAIEGIPQLYPSIAMDAQGNFVVCWISFTQENLPFQLFARRYDSEGNPLGEEFHVNTQTNTNNYMSQHFPDVAMDASGNFIIVWEGVTPSDGGDEIYAQRFDSDGTPLGQQFRINSTTANQQSFPSIAITPDGESFVVTWDSDKQDGSNTGVYARQFNSNGEPLTDDFQANTFTTGQQRFSDVAIDADGDFVIGWRSANQLKIGEYGAYAQRFRSSHTDNLAVWRSSRFYLDSNHSNTWNGSTDDTLNNFGANTDTPLAGDWNGDGYTDIGIWRNGSFYLDANGNGIWDGPAVDRKFNFGISTDTPIVGDWNADGIDDIGIWRAGKFYLDLDGNNTWNSGVDAYFSFGSTTDTPIIGDWNGDGTDDIGIWRAGKFYLDLNGNRAWNSGIDGIYNFGLNSDTPIIGDWNGDGTDDIGVWRAGKFYKDADGSRSWNSTTDTVTTFGSATDTPLIGNWRPKSIPAPAPLPGALPPTNSPISTPTPTTQPDEQTLATLLATPPKKRDW